MSQIQSGDSVHVHYEGRFQDGEVFDSSREREPITFVAGSDQLIPGFSNGVIGMAVGDKKTLELVPAEAYGEPDPERLQKAELAMMPEGVKVGDRLTAESGKHTVHVVVSEIDGDDVTLDANHPLAGKHLVFDIEIVSID